MAGRKVIDDTHTATFGDQACNEMRPNESCAPGNQIEATHRWLAKNARRCREEHTRAKQLIARRTPLDLADVGVSLADNFCEASCA